MISLVGRLRRTFYQILRVVRSLLGITSLSLLVLIGIFAACTWTGRGWMMVIVAPAKDGGKLLFPYVAAVGGRVQLELDSRTSDNIDTFYETVNDTTNMPNWGLPPFEAAPWGQGTPSIDPGIHYQSYLEDWCTPPMLKPKLRMPLGLPALLGIPGLLWLVATARRLRRALHASGNRCGNCGYDLRASPGACPECGSPRPATPARPLKAMLIVGGSVIAVMVSTGAAAGISIVHLARQQRKIQQISLALYQFEWGASYDEDAMLAAPATGAHLKLQALMSSAIAQDHLRLVRELIRRRVDEEGAPLLSPMLLSEAVDAGDPAMLRCLLDAGVDARLPSDYRWPLFGALAETPRQAEILQMLLSHHADPEVRDNSGHTPLLMAAKMGMVESARALLEAGANPDARVEGNESLASDSALTPLLMITGELEVCSIPQKDRCQLAKLLLAHHADVNARDLSGRTPLHGAVALGMYDLTRILVEAGADRSARDDSGRRPIDLHDAYSDEIRQMLTPSAP